MAQATMRVCERARANIRACAACAADITCQRLEDETRSWPWLSRAEACGGCGQPVGDHRRDVAYPEMTQLCDDPPGPPTNAPTRST